MRILSGETKQKRDLSSIFGLEQDFQTHPGDREFSTVFIGGGTPGLLSASQLNELCNLIKSTGLRSDCEWTVEVAPNEINAKKVEALLAGGVNRLSLGVQTLSQDFMMALGRDHDVSTVLSAYDLVRKAGFKSVNLDLLFGAPGQKLEDWKEDLRKAIDLGPITFQLIALLFEEDTALFAKLSEGKIKIDSDREAEFYELAWDFLPRQGYSQYEVSNYAKRGMECRHNLNTWKMKEWIGYGPSASSQYRNIRRKNFANIEKWCEQLVSNNEASYEELLNVSDMDLAWDAILFGLRMNQGVNLNLFSTQFSLSGGVFENVIKFFEQLKNEGLIYRNNENYCLSEEGRMRCDAIAAEVPGPFEVVA